MSVTNESVMRSEKDFAEAMRQVHYNVATSTNPTISAYDSGVYKTSKAAFIAAIAIAYPSLPTYDIYHLWADNNESVAWNAGIVKNRIEDEAYERYEDSLLNIQENAHK